MVLRPCNRDTWYLRSGVNAYHNLEDMYLKRHVEKRIYLPLLAIVDLFKGGEAEISKLLALLVQQPKYLSEIIEDLRPWWFSGPDAAERVIDVIGFEYCLASLSGWTKVEVVIEYYNGVALEGCRCFWKEGDLKCAAILNIGHVPVDEIKVDKNTLIVEDLKIDYGSETKNDRIAGNATSIVDI
ncbi:hypothetical protein Tco_0511054 [Tanacetum coccineum]